MNTYIATFASYDNQAGLKSIAYTISAPGPIEAKLIAEGLFDIGDMEPTYYIFNIYRHNRLDSLHLVHHETGVDKT